MKLFFNKLKMMFFFYFGILLRKKSFKENYEIKFGMGKICSIYIREK